MTCTPRATCDKCICNLRIERVNMPSIPGQSRAFLSVSLLLVGACSAIAQPGAPSAASTSEQPSALWTLQRAKVVARETLDTGTLVTVSLPLDDPQGPKGRTYVTPQSPFVVSRAGNLVFWSAWMNTSPRDNAPALWHALTPASIEIEIKKREPGAKVINTRAVKQTNVSLRKVASNRDIQYVDDNTVEVSLYFEANPEDIADVGVVTYKDSCDDKCRDKGLDVAALKAGRGSPRR